MNATALPQWEGSRHSIALSETAYLGGTGRLMFNPMSRGEVHRMVRQCLRVARTPAEIRRVMRVWREIHYLGRGQSDPIGVRQIRRHYYLDLPALRPVPHPWYPAAAVTIRYALPAGIPAALGLESPLEALEVARRMRQGTDWAEVVAGRVLWRPRWLLTFSDQAMGHDGGLYRGAGAQYLGKTAGGKGVWGWEL